MSVLPWLALALLSGTLGAVWAKYFGQHDPVGGRRLHRHATARGGGIGIALALFVALVVLHVEQQVSVCLALGMLCAAGAGWCEDRFGLPVVLRLAAQVLAGCAIAVALEVSTATAMGLVACILVILSTVALINLVNFMDGANGLLGLQTVIFAAACMGFLDAPMLQWLAVILALATLGFLPWNFPGARVFLGDVGSYGIGYGMALLIHEGAAHQGPEVWIWAAIGLSVLLADAVFTLMLRLVRRERFWRAHKMHLFQWLIRCGVGHTRVSLAMACVAVFAWLLAWLVIDLMATEHSLAVVLLLWLSLAGAWLYARRLLLSRRRRVRA